MRLQKFLARSGVASRRESENLIRAGRVTVNGQCVREMGSKVDPCRDKVALDGVCVKLCDVSCTLMLHKPAGVISTMSDPWGRAHVADYVPQDLYPGLFPVGRLDADTTGLLLFSTDGELGNALLHPKHEVEKCYVALVEGIPNQACLARLRRGIALEGVVTAPAKVDLLQGDAAQRAKDVLDVPPGAPHGVPPGAPHDASLNVPPDVPPGAPHACQGGFSVVRIIIHEGRKRQVKRMFAAVGHPVRALHRDSFGPIELGTLPRGEYRILTQEETRALYCAAGMQTPH